MQKNKILIILCTIILSLSFVIACGSGDETNTDGDNDITDGDGSEDDPKGEEVKETLETLGADLDSYEPKTSELHPMGLNTVVLDKMNELAVIGHKSNNSTMNVLLNSKENFEAVFTETDSTWPDEGFKGGTACDLDGDGLDELVVVIVGETKLRIRIYDDQTNDFKIISEDVSVPWGFDAAAEDIDVACGDLDADSRGEIIIAASETHTEELDTGNEEEPETKTYYNSTVVVLDDSPHKFNSIFTKDYKDFVSVRVDAGNIDNDLNDELVMSFSNKANVNLFEIWDMGEDGLEKIEDGTVQWINDNSNLKTGILSDVTIGDVDADGLGEIIFGGVHESNIHKAAKEFVLVMDDASHDFDTLAYFSDDLENYPGIPDQMNLAMILDTFVELVDLDGDFKPEILSGNKIYKNLYDSEGDLERLAEIPINYYYGDVIDSPVTTGFYKRSRYYVAVGDFTGDAKEDIAIIHIRSPDVIVWGNQLNGEFKQLEQIPTRPTDSSPLLISANVNTDSIVVKYDGDYKFVFTEPIVMAALAAPPCKEGIGQNLDQCSTTFGNATSQTTTQENAITLRASFIVGTSIEDRTFTQSAFELEASVSLSMTAKAIYSYSEEVAVSYSTGALEDAVVFSTIPYDVYTYTITSHPEEGMVGTKTTIAIPRKPIVLIAEREFFNQSVDDSRIQIDDKVFMHTPQDLSSYPKRSDKKDLMDEYGGMESQEMSVGQGSGATDVSLTVSEEWGAGLGMEVGVDLSIKTTAGGVTLGMSIGMSYEYNLTLSAGQSTSFAGSVGSIDAEHFAENMFTFGLFSYPLKHSSGQEFYVLNYWVEEN